MRSAYPDGYNNYPTASSGRLRLIPNALATVPAMPRKAPPPDLRTMRGRLRFAMEAQGLKPAELAERTGINYWTVKKHLSAKGNNFNEQDAKIYARHLKCDWVWLRTGKGTAPGKGMLTTTPGASGSFTNESSREVRDLATIRVIDINAGLGAGGDMIATYRQSPDGSWGPTDAVTAELIFPRRFIIDLGLDPRMTDLVPVKGNSMSPEIEDGDLVFVDRRVQQLDADDIYLFYDGTGHEIKALARVRGTQPGKSPRVRILSANPTYGPQEVPLDDIYIIGRVHFRIGKIVRGR